MEDQEFLELFGQSANLLRERTMQQILEENAEYQPYYKGRLHDRDEKQYLQLDLTETQRRIIDELLSMRERSCLLYADTAYLAGIKNVLQMHRALHL